MSFFSSRWSPLRHGRGGMLALATLIFVAVPVLHLKAQQATTRPEGAALQAAWSNTAMNLRARFVAQSGPLKAGERPSISIEIQNASDKAIMYQCFGAFIQMPQLQDNNNSSLIISQNTPGNGARVLIEAETSRLFGVVRPPFRPDTLMQGYYELQPGGSVFISAQLPWIVAKPGEYQVTGSVPCQDPMSNRLTPQDHSNRLFLPALTFKAGPGDPAAAAAYDIHWGPVTNGLRAGLKVEFGDGPIPQFGYGGWVCLVENTTDNPITFTYTSGAEQEDMPIVKDSAGAVLPVTVHYVEVNLLKYNLFTLAPHQSIGLSHPNFWIVPPGSNESEPYTPILHAAPGDYQATFTFRYKPQGAADWTGTVISGVAPLHIIKGDLQKRPTRLPWERDEVTTSWGNAVEGISCRAWTGPSGSYQAQARNGTGPRVIPVVFLDLGNDGSRNMWGPQTQSLWSLQINGVAYKWTGDVEAKFSPLPPGRTEIYMSLEIDDPSWKDEKGNPPPPLVPGSYKVQVATTCKPADGGKDIHVESAPTTIQVLTLDERGRR